MGAIRKATSWNLRPFLGAIKTGLFTSGMLLPGIILSSGYAIAQVTSDGTTNTTVTPNGNNFKILNGIEKGNNLFHSFSNFSVSTGASASFDLVNKANITTIFSRVTGGNISNIDGLIRTINSSNPVSLFLMNPNGIIFGQNAKLGIGGSFVGTTANSIKFADGTEFSVANPTATSLLTISVPVGLQMGNNPGAIAVQGTGNLLKTQSTLLAPYFPIGVSPGLQVAPRNTLALVGGNITIDGGVLTAPEGRVELASLGNAGSIAILQNQPTVTLGNVVGDRANIQLSNKALVDVNRIDSGSIQIQGRQVDLSKGALLWVQNRGAKTGGNITVNATDRIFADGTAPDLVSVTANGPVFSSVSGIVNETVGTGNGGKISLYAPSVTVQNGASMMSRAFTSGMGGDILINAKTLNISSASKILGDIFSIVGTSAAGAGHGGNIFLNVQDMALIDGGVLAALTIGAGASGDITVNADTVRLRGLSPISSASSLSVPSLGGTGKAGNLLINTRTLAISEGAFISSSSFGPGNAGSITINASESFDIAGFKQKKGNYQTGLSSAVSPPLEPYKSLFHLRDDNATGSSGDVTVNTQTLRIADRGYIVVENTGSGTAGKLQVNADRIELKNAGFLSAGSLSGQGGNIMIHADTLQLRNLGKIYTSSLGSGNGGNIDITANTLVGLGNSDILASAISGRGGRIQIITQGLFGLKYRDRLTPENDITASSQFGVNGTVDINNFGVDPSSSLVELPVNLVDSSQEIAAGCSNNTGSSFVATGRGGVPQNPNQQVTSDVYDGLSLRTWSDIRDLSAHRKTGEATAQIPTSPETLIQASSWHLNPDGKIELIADQSATQVQPSLTCAALPRS
jgi:filamentous hemagglutinin family protein